jgi:hypothetical protein
MEFRLSNYHYTAPLPDSEKIILFSSRSGMGKIISTGLYALLQEGGADLIPTNIFLSLCEAELLVDKAEDENDIVQQRLLHSDYLTISFKAGSSVEQAAADYNTTLQPAITRYLQNKASNILCIHLLLDDTTSLDGLQLLYQQVLQDWKNSFLHIVYAIVLPSSLTDTALLAAWLHLLRPVEINFYGLPGQIPSIDGFTALLQEVAMYEQRFINPAENRRYLAINHFFSIEAFQPRLIEPLLTACNQYFPVLTIRNLFMPPADDILPLLESQELATLVQQGFFQHFLPKQAPVIRCGTQQPAHLSIQGFTDLYDTEDKTTTHLPALLIQQQDYPCTACRLLPLCGGYWTDKEWTDTHCPPFKKHATAILQYVFTLKKTIAAV